MYKNVTKPFLDFFLAFSSVIILSPFLMLLIIFLLFANNGKVLFTQERSGKNGCLFKLIKFRTMIDKTDDDGILLPDRLRITKAGKLMRLLSIDELPQLINILTGTMSFIGPRPLLPKYLSLYNSEQIRRHEVKPGLTGWAQINGRNTISWGEKFKLDIYYVDNISLILDVRIFLLTIISIVRREGINSSEGHTMPSFDGNKDLQ